MVWEEITILGDFRFWVVFALLTLLLYKILPKKTLRFLYFVIMPAMVFATIVSEALKLLVQSPRPCAGLGWCIEGYSFPSSHAVVAFAAFTSIYLGLGWRDKRHLAIFIIPALIAISRVIVGVHRVEDIVAGSAIGIVFAFGYMRVYEHLKERRSEK